MSYSRERNHALSLVVVACGLVALVVIQTANFLLFHALVEMFSILVAFAVFVIAWNARAELDNSFLVILGVSSLFVGSLDLLHTLAYQGMGVFPTAGANLPTQLWLLSRYLQSVSLLVAAFVGYFAVERPSLGIEWTDRELGGLLFAYAAVVALGLGSIFVTDTFPQAYVDGQGLTPFKVFSEYLIVGFLAASLVPLSRQRGRFDSRVFQFIVASIVLAIGAELAFTFYVDVYGISNVVGHFLKLGSFSLLYLAVVKTGIKDPQKMLYRTLARSEAEARTFKKAADYSGHPVTITDRDGTIQYVNDAWEAMTGYTAAEVLGENPRVLQSDQHDQALYADLWETILAGDVWEGEITNVRRDGEQFVVHQTIAPIFDDNGEIQGFVAIHDDITEQKEYERHLESDLRRSVTQLQVLDRVLRHNIRNELNVILGNAEILRENASDQTIERRAGAITDAGERLLSQADKQRDILTLLLESSSERPITLSSAVRDVVADLERRYPTADITVEIPAGFQVRTLRELEQAIEELVENAIIHSDRDVAKVVVQAHHREQTVEIQVEDRGPGIPQVERQVITADAGIDALLHSRGMGLWLVDSIVTEAGGTLHFEDADPHGTIVTLVIPADTDADGVQSGEPAGIE